MKKLLNAWWLLPVVSLFAGMCFGYFKVEEDKLIVLDVGQGDAAVICHRGVNIAIDDGPLKSRSPGAPPAVESALRREGIDHVDLVLLSHPDADHVSGTPEILSENRSARLAISGQFRHAAKLEADLRAWGVPEQSVVWLPEDSRIQIGDETLQISCPSAPPDKDDNNGSMFVRVRLGGATAEFSGDAPQSVEVAEAEREDWRADLLHVGHHGSRSATSDEWLDAVKPREAVISCGRDNPYGHPHRQVLDRLTAHHIPVFRTDLDGDLVFAPIRGHFMRIGQ